LVSRQPPSRTGIVPGIVAELAQGLSGGIRLAAATATHNPLWKGLFFMKAMKLCILPVTLIVLLSGANIFAADTGVSELDQRIVKQAQLVDLLAYAYAKNPSIASARQQWAATVANYRVQTAYPDPQLMVTWFTTPIETRLGPQDWNVTITQPIPFPGKLSKMGQIVETEADMARIQLDKAHQDLTLAVREAFYELSYIRQARAVAEANLKLVDHLRNVGETAYAQDRVALVDMVRAQSQVGQLRYDQILLEDLERTEITRLNGLLNRAPEAPVGALAPVPVKPVAYSLDTLYRMAQAHQDAIRLADTQVIKADQGVDLARFENLPDFRLGLFYAGIGQPNMAKPPMDAGRDAVGIQAGITIPLWFGKSSSRMEKARAELSKAKAQRTGQVNAALTGIRTVFFRLENAGRLMALYRDDLLPQASQSMAVAETWFRQGQSSFSDFVETQSVYYNFQLALARARADYGKALARLERLVGQAVTGPVQRGGKETP
jgi:cobalt-zinc-cadmium efflux system outer membrane protein